MTDKEKLDALEEQTRKDILGDYSNNILIEALAGAGKTTMLVERLMMQAKSMDPSKIVAITFTEKAADELKGRFCKKLLEEYDSASDEEKVKLQPAVDHINDIQISTIHAFCNKLLKEMTFEAGLGLDFEVVQDVKEKATIQSFFESFCRDEAQRPERERLAKAGINGEQLFSTFKEMCKKRGVDEWVYDRKLARDPEGMKKTLAVIEGRKILSTISECLTETKAVKGNTVQGFTKAEIIDGGSGNGSYYPVITDLGKSIYRYVEKNSNKLDPKGMNLIYKLKTTSAGALSGVCYGTKPRGKDCDGACLEKSKASYNAMKDAAFATMLEDSKKEWNGYLHAICMELLVKAYDAYQADRRSGGRITNDELLLLTRDMLSGSKKARDFFREKYRYFYIDEYQDTDPIQTEILQLLTASDATIGKPLDEIEFMDGRFCLIGDPKQSIYGFRGADVRLYAKMRAAIVSKHNCKLYQMNRNYRSNDEICTWVNQKFKKSGPEDFGFATCKETAKAKSSQAGFDHMLSAQAPGDTKTYMKGVYRYYVPSGKKEDMIEADATHVAAMIRNMIDAKVTLSVMDTKTGIPSTRAVEPGDFMILTRKKEGIRSYATKLKAMGIPVLVNGASSISLGDGNQDAGSPLTGFRNLILLSELVAEQNDKNRAYRLALVLVKVFGIQVSPVALFTYCDTIYGEDAKVNLEKVTDEKLKGALTFLSSCVRISKKNPLLAFELLAEKYDALLNYENSHEDLSSELGGLEQILEQIREASYGSYKELHEQFQLILKGKNEKELPMGEAESQQAVHIMNAHLSKGLEANIVILACPAYNAPGFQDKAVVEPVQDAAGKRSMRGYVEVILDATYVGANKYSTMTVGKSEGFNQAAAGSLQLQTEEELRVLYVSGTRPKECLIIADSDKENAWSDLSRDLPIIDDTDGNTPEYQKMIVQGVDYKAGANISSATSKAMICVDTRMDSFVKDQGLKKKGREELCTISELTLRPSDQEQHSSSDSVDSSYMCGNLYGTMMHRFFELLIAEEWKKKLSTDFTEEELTLIVRRAVAAGLESESLTQKQCERLKLDTQLAKADGAKQQEELTKHMLPEFRKLGDGILKDSEFQADLKSAKVIYTELQFELHLDEDGIQSIAGDIKGGYCQGQAIHVRGTMDLLLEMDDRFVIWDYKSDVLKVGESIPSLETRLQHDYAPQLRVYEAALKNIVASDPERSGKPIEAKLYHRFR
ncbi:MAG: UvrD-helicase domain-containing protein [Lachnospiraceae bacterium]